MRKFIEPEIEVLHLDVADIVTSSSVFDPVFGEGDNAIYENELIGWHE